MVALAIASIALVSFVTLVITSMDLEDHARKVTDATLAADDKLKEVERTGFPDVGKTEGLIDEQDPDGFSYVMVVTERLSIRSGKSMSRSSGKRRNARSPLPPISQNNS